MIGIWTQKHKWNVSNTVYIEYGLMPVLSGSIRGKSWKKVSRARKHIHMRTHKVCEKFKTILYCWSITFEGYVTKTENKIQQAQNQKAKFLYRYLNLSTGNENLSNGVMLSDVYSRQMPLETVQGKYIWKSLVKS